MNVRIWLTLASFMLLAACGGGSSGSGTPPPSSSGIPPAPTGLNYASPQVFIVGQPIGTMNPTVSGTVSSYAASPALPAGLNLNTTTGAISGTPMAVRSAATYVITASNAGGSSTANLSITVNDAAPAFAYGSSSYTFVTGVPIAPLTPATTGGTVVTWSLDPVSLPSGLNFDSATGIISGTATAVTAPASYTVSAQNSGGSTTQEVSIGVESGVLLELGHAATVGMLRYEGARVLSIDAEGHWALWNSQTAAPIAQGDSSCASPCEQGGADFAGSTVVVKVSNGFEVRAAGDGQVLSTIDATASWWALASDGSYVTAGNDIEVKAWTPSGTLLFARAGDYSQAVATAAPLEVRIAAGPAGSSVIETIAVASGTASVGSPFQGQFHSWFADGARFFTRLGTTVWIYSEESVQEDIHVLGSLVGLAGTGSWFWAHANPAPLEIFAVGPSTTPAATFSVGQAKLVVSHATLAALVSQRQLSVIDLSGATPTLVLHSTPVAHLQSYAALSSSQWIVGSKDGRLVDPSSPTDPPKYFGLGAAMSIAGGTNRIAVATAGGGILFFDATTLQQEGHIDFIAQKLAMSKDGTVLAASGYDGDAQYTPDRTLKIWTLPSAVEVRTIPYSTSSTPRLGDFELSASGLTLGQILFNVPGTPFGTIVREATPASGGATIWSENFAPDFNVVEVTKELPIRLSPDGSRIAVSRPMRNEFAVTNIFENGVLRTAVPGWVVGWIDDQRILLNRYFDQRGPIYDDAAVANATGQVGPALPLPELLTIQPVTSESVYSPHLNKIFSVTTGGIVWSTPTASRQVGAVAGNRVIFASGAAVRAEPR